MVPMFSTIEKIYVKQGKKWERLLQEGIKVTEYRINKAIFFYKLFVNYVFKVEDNAVWSSNITFPGSFVIPVPKVTLNVMNPRQLTK